jgi:hypothetical protein
MRITKEHKEFYYNIINEALEHEEVKTIEALHKRFLSEYSWNIERTNFKIALVDWLQGLAISIPYMNWEILELAKKSGSKGNCTDDRILENYWNFMASRLIELWKKEKLATQ